MAQLEYISLDTDFFDKPKIKGFVHRHGQGAVSFLLRLLCGMGRSTEGEISRDSWEAIGVEAGLDVERATSLVSYCLENQILAGDLEVLTNSRVKVDQEALAAKRAKIRERVGAYRARRKGEVPADTEVVEIRPPAAPLQAVPKLVRAAPPVATPQRDEGVDEEDPNMEIALEKLETPDGQPWTLDNRFISAGRRPMRDYPTIWLTPHELADVVKKLEESQIPIYSYKDLFLKAEAKMKTYSAQGRSNQAVSVYNWLTGFLFDELLERAIKETRLAKTMEGPKAYEQRR